MTSGAAHFADQAVFRTVEVLEHERLGRDTFRLRFACPEMAARLVPGQFLMLRLAHCNDPLIGRPLAVYDVGFDEAGRAQTIDVVYLAKGKLTSRLRELGRAAVLDVWGPLGNGFSPEPVEHLVMVAGGIGQTPFLALAKEALGWQRFGQPPRTSQAWAGRVTLCYGARTQAYLAGLPQFTALGVDVRTCTEDGSDGFRGLVTQRLEEVLTEASGAPLRVVTCGPEPMMAAVASLTARYGHPCQASLETPMACGIGICFTCVAMIRETPDSPPDYRRTCVEGPVFDACQVDWASQLD